MQMSAEVLESNNAFEHTVDSKAMKYVIIIVIIVVCLQCVFKWCGKTETDNLFLWHEHPSSEWPCWESHSGFTWIGKKNFTSCPSQIQHTINISLWPYAKRTACYTGDILSSLGSNQSGLEKFAEVVVSSSLKHTHLAAHFSLYILHWQETSPLQTGMPEQDLGCLSVHH